MCPHCGASFRTPPNRLAPMHGEQFEDGSLGLLCPGSAQRVRNPESDARPLWNGNPNPYVGGTVEWQRITVRLNLETGDSETWVDGAKVPPALNVYRYVAEEDGRDE